MAINSDHTIGRVHKEGAADYAGVQVGDVIMELNHRRVDANAAVHHISRSIKLSQIQRGRVRIKFYRQLRDTDLRMNLYHKAAGTELSRVSLQHSDSGRGGSGAAMLWTEDDHDLSKRKGSVESVYMVENLDNLVGDIETFHHLSDVNFSECLRLGIESVSKLCKKKSRAGRSKSKTSKSCRYWNAYGVV